MEPQSDKKRHSFNISIDLSRCVGKVSCVDLAPGVFKLKERGFGAGVHSTVINPQGADIETIFLAARSCPTYAIILTDEETGEQVYPYPPRD